MQYWGRLQFGSSTVKCYRTIFGKSACACDNTKLVSLAKTAMKFDATETETHEDRNLRRLDSVPVNDLNNEGRVEVEAGR